ncbi:MAG: cation:proton antiporter [Candidatus Aenigmatarchaeota archaeon]
MPLEALSFLTLIGLTIIVGYIGALIFERTRIPDVIWLMVFGLLVSGLGLMDRSVFMAVSGIMSAVALMMILFDAGLNMNATRLVKGMSRGTLLGFSAMFMSIVVVTAVALSMQIGLVGGLLLGAILAGTCSPTVIGLVNRLRISEHVKSMLNIETIVTDPVTVVIAISMIKIMTAEATGWSVVSGIVTAYSVAIMVGLAVGAAWLLMLQRLRGRPYDYMLTMAVLALLYVFVESVGGSGAIASLVFGLVLGNAMLFSKSFRPEQTDGHMRDFYSQLTFFIRAFFFVFIGLIATLEPTAAMYGIFISILLIVVRLLATHVSTLGMTMTDTELNLIRIMGPRGLTAAVLASLPLAYGIAGGELMMNITFVVIIATVIYTTLAVRLFYRPPQARRKDLITRSEK